MKKKINKILMACIPFAFITPIITTSCSNTKNKNINLLANYDNALDALLSLGVAPQHYLSNFYKYGNDKSYAPYINELSDMSKTNVEDIYIYDGQETDLKNLARLKPYSLLVNEWERVDEKQYDGIVDHIMYTSMGDTIERRWNKNDDIATSSENGNLPDYSMTRFYKDITVDPTQSDGEQYGKDHYGTFDWGVSPQKALLQAANDIDKTYNTGGIFVERAKIINKKLEERIKLWNNDTSFINFLSTPANSNSSNNTNNEVTKTPTTFPSTDENTQFNTTNVSIGIILGGTKNDGSSFKLLTPNAFPMLYSQLQGRGLGFNFPNATNPNFKNTTHYVDTYITASNGEGKTLIDEFKNKFDYLIYAESLSATTNNTPANLNEIKNLLTVDSDSSDDIETRIYQTTYQDAYMSIWGTMGYTFWLDELQTKILPKFAKATNNTSLETTNVRIKYPKNESLINIYPDTDFSKFPKWEY